MIMPSFGSPVARIAKIPAAALAGLGIIASPTLAAGKTCDGVKVEATKPLKQEYAPLVAAAMQSRIKPAQVTFHALLESGDWSAVYVSTPVSDDGVLFFRTTNGKKQFRDVWGGWAESSERPELVAWARKLGAPTDLAKCFAEMVTE